MGDEVLSVEWAGCVLHEDDVFVLVGDPQGAGSVDHPWLWQRYEAHRPAATLGQHVAHDVDVKGLGDLQVLQARLTVSAQLGEAHALESLSRRGGVSAVLLTPRRWSARAGLQADVRRR